MGTKLGKKERPPGHSAGDFKYMGRPAKDQGDFGADVGLADMACVNQFGEANNSKCYHGGVVQSTKDQSWWAYFQWGRIAPGNSWTGDVFAGGDFQFVRCSSEADARDEFASQMASKNTKRLVKKDIGGVAVWTAKPDKDGYIVQSLATRTRGLPDAYGIKDSTGVAAPSTPKTAKKSGPSLSREYHQEELSLASSLLGGTKDYTRSLSRASGVVPTMDAITQVRDSLIPAALSRCAAVGNNIKDQVNDPDLRAISKMVFAMVPREIPRTGLTEDQAVLNAGNVLNIQQDLDAFEAALKGEDWSTETTTSTGIDPDLALNARLTWIDPTTELGTWVANTYRSMTRNRHGDLHGQKLRIRNMFSIERPDRDARFVAAVKEIAARRQASSNGHEPPGLQPNRRPDLSDVSDYAANASVFFGIHGTRGVNVAPILGSHLRLPKSLKGVQITGAAFGHGIYFATDLAKSWGYTGYSARWGSGGGNINGRGAFMFLADVAGGKFYYPRSAWGIDAECPDRCDSVYAHPSRCSTLQNDEHVVFNADHCRLRYVVEMDFV